MDQELPFIKVTFDAATQAVGISFKTAEFKNWAFVAGLLEIAKCEAEHQNALAKMAAMQQAARQQQMEQQVHRSIMRGSG